MVSATGTADTSDRSTSWVSRSTVRRRSRAVGRHHAVRQLDVEQPREHAQTLEGRSLVVVEELHGHVDRGADAAVAGTEVALAALEEVEPVLGVAQVVGG